MAGTGPSERKRKRKKVADDSSESEGEEEASASENEWGDRDNNDYLEFLTEFLFPGQNNSMEINDDDDADPEYNITEDEEEEDHDREELRRDPAVKISKKELNELLAEVFDESVVPKKKSKHKQKSSEVNSNQIQHPEVTNSVMESPCSNQQEQQDQSVASAETSSVNNSNVSDVSVVIPMSNTTAELSSVVEAENKQEEPLLNEITILKIKYQLQQHVQLLSQTYVLTAACSNSEVALALAKDSKRMITELYGFSNSYGLYSVFKIKNISFAFNLVNTWPACSIVSRSPIKKKILEERYLNEAFHISGGNGLLFTRNMVKVISENPVFMYPELLPRYPNLLSEYKINFTPNEDALIAIGYREMQDNSAYDILKTKQKAKLIGDMLLPGRPITQIFHRIKNARKLDKSDNNKYHGLRTLTKYLRGETTPESQFDSWTPDLLQKEPIAPISQPDLPVTWIALIKRLKLDILFKDDLEEKEKKPRKTKACASKRHKTQNQNAQNKSAVNYNSNTEGEEEVGTSLQNQCVANLNSLQKRALNNKNSLKPVNFNTKPLTVCDRSELVQANNSVQYISFSEETMERIPVMNRDGTPAIYVNIPKRFFRPSASVGTDPQTQSVSIPSCSSPITSVATTTSAALPTQEVLDLTPVGAPFSLSVLQNENISTADSGCIIDVQSLESPLKREIFHRASQSPTEPTVSPLVVMTTAVTPDVDVTKPDKEIDKFSKSKVPKNRKVLQDSSKTKNVSSVEENKTSATPAEQFEAGSSLSRDNTEGIPVSYPVNAEIVLNNFVHKDVAYSREDHSARTWIYQRKSLAEIHAAIERKLHEGKIKADPPPVVGDCDCDGHVDINDSSSDEGDKEDDEAVLNFYADSSPSFSSHMSVPELTAMSPSSDSSHSLHEDSFSQNQTGELNTPFKFFKTKTPTKVDSRKGSEPVPLDAGESKGDGSTNKSENNKNPSGSGSSRAPRGSGSSCKKEKQVGRLGQTAGSGDGDGDDQDPLPPNKKGCNPFEKMDDDDHKEEDTEDCEDDEKETSDHSSPRRSHQSNNNSNRGKSDAGSCSGPNSKNQNSSQVPTPVGKKIKRSPGSQVKKRITKYKTAEIQKLLDDADSEVNVEAIETAFAEEFWAKCHHTVDPVLYNNLLQVFCDFEEKHSSEEEVFTKVEEMLKDYPDLLVDLATMIEPQLLQKNNLLKDNYVCQAYIRFMHLLECPPLKARVLQKLRAIRDLEKVSEKDVQELVDLYFQGNPIMTDALKAMFPAIFPPESIVRSEDFEEINLDDDSVMGTTEEAMAVELINLPEEANVPATASCPCDCHTDPRNVSYHAKARHCRKCCIKFQDGKVFMHSGRLMKQVNISFTSKEKAEQILAGTACGHCFEPLKTVPSGSPSGKLKSTGKRSPKKLVATISRLKGIVGSDGDSEVELVTEVGEAKLAEVVDGSHAGSRRDGNQSQEEDDLEEGEIVDDEDYDAEGDDDQSEGEISSSKTKEQQSTSNSANVKYDPVKSHQVERHHQQSTVSKEKEKEAQEKGKSEKSWTFNEDKIILFTCQQEPSPTVAIEKILRSKALPCRTAEDIRDRLSYLLAMIRRTQAKEGDGDKE